MICTIQTYEMVIDLFSLQHIMLAFTDEAFHLVIVRPVAWIRGHCFAQQ